PIKGAGVCTNDPEMPERKRGGKERASTMPSLDDLVGTAEDRQRNGQAERIGGLQIDDQLEFRRLLDREIGRVGALQGPVDVVGRNPEHLRDVWPIRHQKTAFGLSA